MKRKTTITELELILALRQRFSAPAWALLPQVRNGTGYARRTTRTADAIAMSLWPSRGLELHGFEVKVSRSDWLRELADPAKAEEIGAYCNRWWIVASDASIVQLGELPTAWGLLVLKGKKLVAKIEAPPREAKGIDLPLLAALMRRMHETIAERVDRAEVEVEVERRLESEKHGWLGEERDVRVRVEQVHKALLKDVETFEERAGISIRGWSGGRVGDAVRLVLEGVDLQRRRTSLEYTAKELEAVASQLRAATAWVEESADG